MKHLVAVLGVVFGLTTVLSAQTASDSPRPRTVLHGTAKAREDARIARAVQNHRAVYYITTYTATGSLIPEVVRRYEGSYTGMSTTGHSSIYGQTAISDSGSLNLGGALQALDPAISSARR